MKTLDRVVSGPVLGLEASSVIVPVVRSFVRSFAPGSPQPDLRRQYACSMTKQCIADGSASLSLSLSLFSFFVNGSFFVCLTLNNSSHFYRARKKN